MLCGSHKIQYRMRICEDVNFAEAGYSWEAFVFDGRIELDHLDASNPVMLSKWPSFLVNQFRSSTPESSYTYPAFLDQWRAFWIVVAMETNAVYGSLSGTSFDIPLDESSNSTEPQHPSVIDRGSPRKAIPVFSDWKAHLHKPAWASSR